MKQFEKVKQQLKELSEPVNSFTSESVQLMVIDWVLDHLEYWNRKNHDSDSPATDAESNPDHVHAVQHQDPERTES